MIGTPEVHEVRTMAEARAVVELLKISAQWRSGASIYVLAKSTRSLKHVWLSTTGPAFPVPLGYSSNNSVVNNSRFYTYDHDGKQYCEVWHDIPGRWVEV